MTADLETSDRPEGCVVDSPLDLADSPHSSRNENETRWQEVQERAFRFLERAERLEPQLQLRGFRSTVRLWRHRAGGDAASWTIFLPERGDTDPIVREVRWAAPGDRLRVFDPRERIKRLADPLPSISVRDLRFPPTDVHELLEDLAKLPSPDPDSAKPEGSGGAAFGIREVSSQRGLWLSWWEQGPLDWAPLTQWVREAIWFFEG